MRFIDEAKLTIEAGDGGNGVAAFRREPHVPFGGPSGGDGGRGGDVFFVGDEGKNSLLDLKHLRKVSAGRGEHGRGRDQYGKAGHTERVRMPIGTIVKNAETGELVGELLAHDEELLVAKGGDGGRGNKHFATPTDRAPQRAEEGFVGEKLEVTLELKVMADVGLLGFPNVGKSTFISVVSAARPKIADYPFTTLVPQLGVVHLDRFADAMPGQTMVVADIPGLVPGASEGAGLGSRFLRHVHRTKVLLHLVTLDPAEDRDPVEDYKIIRGELEAFDPELASREEVLVLSKGDLPEVQEAYPELKERFEDLGRKLELLSSPTHTGLKEVIYQLMGALERQEQSEQE